ncbi:hypothetical protein EXS70_04845 [Candidatus Peribacteria bacterium]|nr:hypothetical protein [Candidatus Peribacteria bacterium]
MSTPIPPSPTPPKIPTGKELYDALMEHIEPELTSEGSKLIEEKYKGETPENKAARMQRYDLAFERYEQAYHDYMDTLDTQVVRYRREAFSRSELEDRKQEEGLLDQLSSLFEKAA